MAKKQQQARAVPTPTNPVFVSKDGAVVRTSLQSAGIQLVRDNGASIDTAGRITDAPKVWRNKTIVDEDGKPIPFSDGVICRQKTGGSLCQFADAGKLLRVLRIGNQVIIPGRVFAIGTGAVPVPGGCTPQNTCPSTCANNIPSCDIVPHNRNTELVLV